MTWHPRSPHEAVEGYVWLPRMLDKARFGQGDYLSLDQSFMDTRFLRSQGVSAEQVRGWIAEGLDDAAIALRIGDVAGRDEAARLAWSRGFERLYKIGFVALDADEERLPPGPVRTVLKGCINLGFVLASTFRR